jgi:hypothetical protein
MTGLWNQNGEKLGKAQIDLGKDVLYDENFIEEKKLSEKDKQDRSKFCISVDAGWNNCGLGKSYNSDSGHHLMVGNRSGEVVALHYMSKCCSKCEKETKTFRSREHDDSICSQNYFGCSKEMEAHDALESVTYFHEKHVVVMEEYIMMEMDDDSSSENILQWD